MRKPRSSMNNATDVVRQFLISGLNFKMPHMQTVKQYYEVWLDNLVQLRGTTPLKIAYKISKYYDF